MTSDLRADVASMMARQWRPEGYTSPNATTYPWMWLWDSCFHALVWAELGDDRSAIELCTVLSGQLADGFVPHMSYAVEPRASRAFWGVDGRSTITQPPMYAHAAAELRRRGVDVGDEFLDRARVGLRHLFDCRDRIDGLVVVLHPWETGCDDSARWDDVCPDGTFDAAYWYEMKGRLVRALGPGDSARPRRNEAFPVAPVGFNALLADAALELSPLVGDDRLAEQAAALVEALAARWDPGLRTWCDAGALVRSGRARTVDGLLPLLVDSDPGRARAALDELADPAAYAAPFGLRGTHAAEPSYEPDRYWRGGSWPQLDYLLWRAVRRHHRLAGARELAAAIASRTVRGAAESGLSEYWNADDGTGGGARPQSWAGLAVLMDAGSRSDQ